jgi:prophage tail gpP-like protein
MSDDLELRVTSLADGRAYSVRKFVDYEIDCSLFTCDTAFAVNLIPDKDTLFAPGDLAELYIIGKKAASGRIEKVVRKYDKRSRGYAVYGRSFAAILIDNVIKPEMCKVYEDKKMMELMQMFLAQIEAPFRPRLSFAETFSIETDNAIREEITRGETYWDVLSRIATARGLFLASLADGSLELRYNARMDDERVFALETGNNILSAEVTYDETKRYLYYIVDNQSAKGTLQAIVVDKGAVFPRATTVNPEQDITDKTKLEAYGELHKIKQIKESMQYTYAVAGHDQSGNVWGVGAAVKLRDDILGITGDYLITGTRFTLAKQEGQRTTLTLSPLL